MVDRPTGDTGELDEVEAILASVQPIEIQEEMENSFLDYAMSVIVSRACPMRATVLSRCTAGSSGGCTT